MPYTFDVVSSAASLPFDLFAFVFYHLSRYEEYASSAVDQHDRWSSDQSWIVKNELILLPIVDLWIEYLRKKLQAEGILLPKTKKFKLLPTIDIDMPYAYRDRPMKSLLALSRDLLFGRFSRVQKRISALRSNKDPFDEYSYLLDRLKEIDSLFFFLCRWAPPRDENYHVDHASFKELVTLMNESHDIGVHPSYQSMEQPELISAEKKILSVISKASIFRSRFHFLRYRLPRSYRVLIDAGITEDHSMMYPDRSGFRAGTCHPFYWYDLEREETTDLTIHPSAIMDVTLKDYMSLSPAQAISHIDEIVAAVRSVDGTLSFIWHNSSFSEIHGWAGWRSVFGHLLSLSE